MAEDLKNKQEELLEDELDKVAGGVEAGPARRPGETAQGVTGF